jgi:hypothetical protein
MPDHHSDDEHRTLLGCACRQADKGARTSVTLSRYQEELLVRGLDDWIHAAEVAFVAGKVGGAGTADRRRELSIAAITDLLARGLIQIGLGELFWLNLTPEGQRLANEIWANQKSHEGVRSISKVKLLE